MRKKSLDLIRQGKVDQVFPKPQNLDSDLTAEYNSWLERVKSVVTSPKMKDIEVIDLIVSSNPSSEQMESILELFVDKSQSPSQYQDINKRIQKFNPIGEALWSSYIPALSQDHIQFTEHYSEEPNSRLRNISDLPSGMSLADIIRTGETEPKVPNTAHEQIMDLKLKRLARWYGMNLENENDMIKFNIFMKEFDVSPGEKTLEWTVPSNPPEHTFEELPIIKIPDGEKIEDHI